MINLNLISSCFFSYTFMIVLKYGLNVCKVSDTEDCQITFLLIFSLANAWFRIL